MRMIQAARAYVSNQFPQINVLHFQLLQSYSFFDLIDCSLPGSSVHRIFLARIVERIAIPSSRGSSQPRD